MAGMLDKRPKADFPDSGQLWKIGLSDFGCLASFEYYDQNAGKDQEERNDLGLGGMKAEDIVLGIHPDLFYHESFNSI